MSGVKIKLNSLRFHRRKRPGLCLAWPLIIWMATQLSSASETVVFTNWNGLSFRLEMQKTNFFVGETIEAGISLSNLTDNARMFASEVGDPCRAGIGEFLITRQKTGDRVKCAYSQSERGHIISAKLAMLDPHELEEFGADLSRGYALTNVGVYSLQAVASFRVLDATPTNCTAITPPITIIISAPSHSTNRTCDVTLPATNAPDRAGTNSPTSVPR